MDTEQVKTKYPYITEKQLEKIENLEASYTDFLNEEDLQEHKDAALASEAAERAAQIQAIIDGLNAAEQMPEVKMLIQVAHDEAANGRKRMLEFMGADKYIDQSMRHSFIQYEPLRGLRSYTDAYTDGDGISNAGYNLRFEFMHESGAKFRRSVAGEGSMPIEITWEYIPEKPKI